MVCDVLVCEVWKAGGLFGNITDSIQCTEFTNFDAYSLNIFDTNYERPMDCVVADPDSQYVSQCLCRHSLLQVLPDSGPIPHELALLQQPPHAPQHGVHMPSWNPSQLG